MRVKRTFVDLQPGQLIQIGLDEHANSAKPVNELFAPGMMEVMVARADKEKATLVVTAPKHFLIMRKSSSVDK